MDNDRIKSVCRDALQHFESHNLRVFKGMKDPLICVSDVYCGVWLEHVGDAVMYAALFPKKGLPVAVNTVETFIGLQKNGQYPCYVWDAAVSKKRGKNNVGYGQLQECVSFGSLCLRVCEMANSDALWEKCYRSIEKWVGWLKKYRMTMGTGLDEIFVGYDTGHDNSGRLDGMLYKENRKRFGLLVGAEKAPKRKDSVAPLLGVDVNACLYGNLVSLAKAAERLGLKDEEKKWQEEAESVKRKMFEILFDENDDFFYDVDKTGKRRKYLSCAIFSLFQEGVLDQEKDKDVVDRLLKRHILNEKEFLTPYPFPSMAISDPSAKNHFDRNDWGYFTQGNTALRTAFWMDKYGLAKVQDYVCRQWLEAWTKIYDRFPIGQELDPITGENSPSSPRYSTGILFYLWSAKRLLADDFPL